MTKCLPQLTGGSRKGGRCWYGGRMERGGWQSNEPPSQAQEEHKNEQRWLKTFEMAKAHWQRGGCQTPCLDGCSVFWSMNCMFYSWLLTAPSPPASLDCTARALVAFSQGTLELLPWAALRSHRGSLSKREVSVLISIWEAALPRVHTWSFLICQPPDRGGSCMAAKPAA